MGFYEWLTNQFPYQINKKQPDPTVPVTEDDGLFFGQDADVPLEKIVDYLRRDAKFQYVCYTLMGYSVGSGFNNTANTQIPSGRKCLELINNFTEVWDLDTINQKMALDAWASGNAFLNVTPNAEKLKGIYHLPLSIFKKINRSIDGEVQFYTIKTKSSFEERIPANEIAHFKLWPIDESAWGEGIGQVLARQGRGYKTSSGKTIHRPSFFEQNEMYNDVNAKIFYSGQPRFGVSPDGETKFDENEMSSINTALKKLDPLQHIIFPKKTKVEEFSLKARSAFDSLTDRFDKEFSIATKTPLIELATSNAFNYASSQTALETMLPLLSSFQRSYKRYIETQIYNPLIFQAGKDPKIVNVQINWGPIQTLSIEEIKIIQDILNQPDLINKHSPEDIINMLVEAGVPLAKTQILVGQSQNMLNFLYAIESVIDNKSKVKELILQEREKMAHKQSTFNTATQEE